MMKICSFLGPDQEMFDSDSTITEQQVECDKRIPHFYLIPTLLLLLRVRNLVNQKVIIKCMKLFWHPFKM